MQCHNGAPDIQGRQRNRNPQSQDGRKIEEIEAGYDTLIEMQPDEERKYLEKKAGILDEAIQMHARILLALAKCPSKIKVNRTHQGGDDKEPQVRIRESLKPDKLKLDFSPMEYRRWTAQIKTFFAASNLQYAPYQEQIGYLHMSLDPNLSNHVSVTAQGDTPIMTYEEEIDEEETCLDIIEAEFIKIKISNNNSTSRPHTRQATTGTTVNCIHQQHVSPRQRRRHRATQTRGLARQPHHRQNHRRRSKERIDEN